MYFAAMSAAELVQILGVFVLVVTGAYALAQKQTIAMGKEREADREERKELSAAITAMAEATKESGERQAIAIERQADEAKERNGHLAELELTSQEMFQKLADRNYQAITNIKEQVVAEQVINHQTLVSKEDYKEK